MRLKTHFDVKVRHHKVLQELFVGLLDGLLRHWLLKYINGCFMCFAEWGLCLAYRVPELSFVII